MFSKALFKQSCKANWVKWLTVTIATCAMLAIVIIVLGNLGINDIRDSLKNIFVQADQESALKENAVDSYDLYLSSVTGYESLEQKTNYIIILNTTFDTQVNSAESEKGSALTREERNAIITQITESIINSGMLGGLGLDEQTARTLITTYLTSYSEDQLSGAEIPPMTIEDNGEMVTNPAFLVYAQSLMKGAFLEVIYQNAYNDYINKGYSVEEATASALVAKDVADDAIENYKLNGSTASYDYKDDAREYVNILLENQAKQQLQGQDLTEDEIEQYGVSVKVISNTAISTYQLWLAEGVTVDEARSHATESISDQLDEKVAEALSELGNMDIYGLIIGSIFYRIAGLLLPMVFVIMVANGLLAGQVDSGSMAYVLSTPTKRRTVTVTQMAYLLFALFAMFALLTVVSVISVWVVGGNSFAINYGEILLFNAGAFLTMFAIAGFCFMCSAIFNRTKYSLSIGGGLTIFSLVCTILGLFGSAVVPSAMRISAMNFFNYLSIITFFDTVSILGGTLSYLWKFGVLAAIGIVTFIIGVFRFDKKDLPL